MIKDSRWDFQAPNPKITDDFVNYPSESEDVRQMALTLQKFNPKSQLNREPDSLEGERTS